MYTSLNDVPAISNKLYAQVSEFYREAAVAVNDLEGTKYSAAQMQAITWVAWRRMNNVG